MKALAKNSSTLLFLLFFISCSNPNSESNAAQDKEYVEVSYETREMQVIPDKFAQYPGGFNGIIKHCAANFKKPDSTFSGRVLVSFVVNQRGKVEQIKVLKSVN